jgi:hypothetical protein
MSERKINPRWEKAPFERTFINTDGSQWIPPNGMTHPDMGYPWRYEAGNPLPVPPFQIEQPDGTWKESW